MCNCAQFFLRLLHLLRRRHVRALRTVYNLVHLASLSPAAVPHATRHAAEEEHKNEVEADEPRDAPAARANVAPHEEAINFAVTEVARSMLIVIVATAAIVAIATTAAAIGDKLWLWLAVVRLLRCSVMIFICISADCLYARWWCRRCCFVLCLCRDTRYLIWRTVSNNEFHIATTTTATTATAAAARRRRRRVMLCVCACTLASRARQAFRLRSVAGRARAVDVDIFDIRRRATTTFVAASIED